MNAQNAGPVNWGSSNELTPLDTLMWRADTDRAMRSTMIAMEVLDTRTRLESACASARVGQPDGASAL